MMSDEGRNGIGQIVAATECTGRIPAAILDCLNQRLIRPNQTMTPGAAGSLAQPGRPCHPPTHLRHPSDPGPTDPHHANQRHSPCSRYRLPWRAHSPVSSVCFLRLQRSSSFSFSSSSSLSSYHSFSNSSRLSHLLQSLDFQLPAALPLYFAQIPSKKSDHHVCHPSGRA